MTYYLAYGSNLNLGQMAYRCPTAKPVGTAILKNWRLVYKGSLTGAYLTIEPAIGDAVPLGVWAVNDPCVAALDRYEGYPNFYSKGQLTIEASDFEGNTLGCLTGLIYIMNPERQYAIPSARYIRTCKEGYKDFGFDQKILNQALKTTRRNLK